MRKRGFSPFVWLMAVSTPERLELISWLADVYFMRGSLVSHYSLERVGLYGRATHLVLLANPVTANEDGMRHHDALRAFAHPGRTEHQSDQALADADTLWQAKTQGRARFRAGLTCRAP